MLDFVRFVRGLIADLFRSHRADGGERHAETAADRRRAEDPGTCPMDAMAAIHDGCCGEESVRRRIACEARTFDAPLLQERRRFAADNRGGLSERAVVLELFVAIVGALLSAFRPRASLVAENLALRQSHPYAEWTAQQIVESFG